MPRRKTFTIAEIIAKDGEILPDTMDMIRMSKKGSLTQYFEFADKIGRSTQDGSRPYRMAPSEMLDPVMG